MMNTFNNLLNDEAGFIVSAELVLVATITVLSMIVGLSEVALNVNNELEDVGSAMQCLQQSYYVEGFYGHQACTHSSSFGDCLEFCAGQGDIN